jgi:hypothetical protein
VRSGPPSDTSVENDIESTPAVAAAHTTTEETSPGQGSERLGLRLFLASVVVAVVPVATACGRAIVTGWIPTEDNALFAIRARDLFTHTHLPLIGTWSSASLNVGTQVNHPGPLYFDLLAVPARLSNSGAGVALGVALVNALCIAGIAWFAYRRGGALVGTAAMATTAALCWAMGSELLFEPWNPHSAMLPFLFFLVLVWSMTRGDVLAVPFAAGVGSLVMQTHLSYALLVPLLGAWGVVGLFLWLRAERRADAGAWPHRRTQASRFGAAGAVVAVMCWLQPLIEQFTSDGSGNLTRLADSARDAGSETIGYGFGARVVATVVSLPPWWFRPSLSEQFTTGWEAPSLAAALLSLAVLALVLAWCAWDARRRRDRMSSWAVATAVVGMVAALITAGRGPVTVFGKVTPHTFRWLWPLGAFVFFAVAITIARRFARRAGATAQSLPILGVFAVATLVVAVLNIPYADEGLGPNSQEYAIPAAQDLAHHMGSLEDEGPLLIDDLFHGAFADPYGGTAVAELQRRSIDFVADDPVLVRQFGPARRFDGTNAEAQLLLRTGDAAREAPPGSRRVALGEGLFRAERRELARLKAEIAGYLEADRLRLNDRGQAALRRGDLPKLAEVEGQGGDAQALFDARELDVMIRQRYLVLDDTWDRRLERYADLQQRADLETVALFLAPLP